MDEDTVEGGTSIPRALELRGQAVHVQEGSGSLLAGAFLPWTGTTGYPDNGRRRREMPWLRFTQVRSGGTVRRVKCRKSLALIAGVSLCLAALAPGAATAAPTPRGASALPFTVRLSTSGPIGLAAISCPTTQVCTTVGGDSSGTAVIFRTSDGGVTWTQQYLPSAAAELQYVSCPTVTFCIAEDETSYPDTIDEPTTYSTTDGGAHWVKGGSFEFVGETNALACASATSCYVLGSGQAFRSTDGGATWVQLSWHSSIIWEYSYGLSCVAPSTCFATGEYFAPPSYSTPTPEIVRIVGSSVLVMRMKSSVTNLSPSAISCTSSSACNVIGSSPKGVMELLKSSNGGVTWSARPLPPTIQYADALSCSTLSVCSAIVESHVHPNGLLVATTSNGAVSWTVARVTWAGGRGALSCPAPGSCVVTSADPAPTGSVLVAHGEGSIWSRVSVQVHAFGPMHAVACPTASTCVALDSPVPLRSTDGGVRWAPEVRAPIGVDWSAISCPTASLCIAAGSSYGARSSTIAFRSTDAGATWHSLVMPAGNQSISSLACTSASTCIATSDDPSYYSGNGYAYAHYFRTTNGGVTWARLRALDPLHDVACSSRIRCVAVDAGGGVYVSVTAGRSFTPILDLNASSTQVACTSHETCFAIGTKGNRGDLFDELFESENGGMNWRLLESGMSALGALGCSSRTCWYTEGGNSLVVSTDDGATWRASPLPTGATVDAGTVVPGGDWVLVGGNPQAGAMAVTSP